MLMRIDGILAYGYIIPNKKLTALEKSMSSPRFLKICEKCGESEYFFGEVITRVNSQERYRIVNLDEKELNRIINLAPQIKKDYINLFGKEPEQESAFSVFINMTRT